MDWHVPRGSAPDGPWSLSVTPDRVGWRYTSLRVLELAPDGGHSFATGAEEMILLPLAGACSVRCNGVELALSGRDGVFERVSDFCYLPRGADVAVRSVHGGRFALAGAPADRDLPVRYGPAESVPIELRGAGSCSRQVNNIATAESFECDRLMVVEVLTPECNWSSYPPHKHDEATDGETELEEIYYFEVAGGGVAYQRVYGSAERPIDVLAEVRDRDVVLVPHGYHGPSMAVPGYHLYYLNAMAGPERAWRFCFDPAHAWVRDTWAGQTMDPRLPLTTHRGEPPQ